MNNSPRARLLLAGVCLLLCSVAKGKDYAIEVIFFTPQDALSQTAEQFPVDRIIPAPDNGLHLFAEDQDPQADSSDPQTGPPGSHFDNPLTAPEASETPTGALNIITQPGQIRPEASETPTDALNSHFDTPQAEQPIWQALPREKYILNEVADRLKRSGRYRILKHIAWRQPMVDKNQAKAIQIYAGRDFSELFPERAYRRVEFGDTMPPLDQDQISNAVRELAGTVRVAITRYLHVYTDLVYRLPGDSSSGAGRRLAASTDAGGLCHQFPPPHAQPRTSLYRSPAGWHTG